MHIFKVHILILTNYLPHVNTITPKSSTYPTPNQPPTPPIPNKPWPAFCHYVLVLSFLEF